MPSASGGSRACWRCPKSTRNSNECAVTAAKVLVSPRSRGCVAAGPPSALARKERGYGYHITNWQESAGKVGTVVSLDAHTARSRPRLAQFGWPEPLPSRLVRLQLAVAIQQQWPALSIIYQVRGLAILACEGPLSRRTSRWVRNL